MSIMVECPICKRRLPENAKKCITKNGTGCGAKIPKYRIYWIEYRDEKNRKRRERIGPSRKAAITREQKIKIALTEERYVDLKKSTKITVHDFIEEIYRPWTYANNKTKEIKRRNGKREKVNAKTDLLNKIVKRWGRKSLLEIDLPLIEAFKSECLDRQSTFNRTLSTLKHMFTLAQQYDLVDFNPLQHVKKFKENTGRVRYLLKEEIKKLVLDLDENAPEISDLVKVALLTGGRGIEVRNIRVMDIDMVSRTLWFPERISKNEEGRYVPINRDLACIFDRLCRGKSSSDYVLTNKKGLPFKSVPVEFNRALRRNNIQDFVFHDLRHTYASHLAMNRAQLLDIKELLGHKKIEMTLRYAHLCPDHKAKAVARLNGLIG